MAYHVDALRVLIVPGLHGSGAGHWQSWLQGRLRGAVRVEQDDWDHAEPDAWAARIGETIARHGGSWVAVAHSFGCIALARHAVLTGAPGVAAALLVAPAEPARFGCAALLPQTALPFRSQLVASRNDPWMSFDSARSWARCWGSELFDLGEAGHINCDSGFGPWPRGARLLQRQLQAVERRRRLQRAGALELRHAV
ncbi:RBBP9/YdeN family alpha/beta hydrolase [Caldimonas tepidiphila]|uniref:RBBP9/YdeN family alpha/beta hydrolase n=1 Tax=Caldimonas tepidiphila TaxID=2315841 RepID=UPI000E5C4357|nr:alpha/beta hydrolase [Caldimonas tepidiphila]